MATIPDGWETLARANATMPPTQLLAVLNAGREVVLDGDQRCQVVFTRLADQVGLYREDLYRAGILAHRLNFTARQLIASVQVYLIDNYRMLTPAP